MLQKKDSRNIKLKKISLYQRQLLTEKEIWFVGHWTNIQKEIVKTLSLEEVCANVRWKNLDGKQIIGKDKRTDDEKVNRATIEISAMRDNWQSYEEFNVIFVSMKILVAYCRYSNFVHDAFVTVGQTKLFIKFKKYNLLLSLLYR